MGGIIMSGTLSLAMGRNPSAFKGFLYRTFLASLTKSAARKLVKVPFRNRAGRHVADPRGRFLFPALQVLRERGIIDGFRAIHQEMEKSVLVELRTRRRISEVLAWKTGTYSAAVIGLVATTLAVAGVIVPNGPETPGETAMGIGILSLVMYLLGKTSAYYTQFKVSKNVYGSWLAQWRNFKA